MNNEVGEGDGNAVTSPHRWHTWTKTTLGTRVGSPIGQVLSDLRPVLGAEPGDQANDLAIFLFGPCAGALATGGPSAGFAV